MSPLSCWVPQKEQGLLAHSWRLECQSAGAGSVWAGPALASVSQCPAHSCGQAPRASPHPKGLTSDRSCSQLQHERWREPSYRERPLPGHGDSCLELGQRREGSPACAAYPARIVTMEDTPRGAGARLERRGEGRCQKGLGR